MEKTRSFIARAQKVHGSKYDYSRVEYVHNALKVTISCPTHGDFEQSPNSHLNKRGCPRCGRQRIGEAHKFSTDDFITKAKKVHGDKYDYSQVVYNNAYGKVIINCPEHGEFQQLAYSHLSGKGCTPCGVLYNKELFRLKSSKGFSAKALAIHGNKYDFSKVIYINAHTKVEIVCPTHGSFYLTPNAVLNGYGCKKCSTPRRIATLANQKRLTTKIFSDRATKVHEGKYDYSLVDYKHSQKKVSIICPSHGEFRQVASDHLMGTGCPKCVFSKGERRIDKWLTSNNIEFTIEKTFKSLKSLRGNKSPAYDFCIPSHKLLIEFDGIQHYKPIKRFGGEERFIKQVATDKMKNQWAKANNWKLLRIPYTQEQNIESILGQELLK